MTILLASELSVYAPGANVSGELPILIAQNALQSFLGWDIELQSRIEILDLTANTRTAQFSYWPLKLASPTPVVEVREGNTLDGYGRAIPLTEWYTLAAGDYNLDATGLLTLNTSDTSLIFGRLAGQSSAVRATYTAGLDFSATTLEIKMLKAALGQIIQYQQSPSYTSGVQEIDIFRKIRTKLASGFQQNNGSLTRIPPDLFAPFQRYRPRGAF